MRYRSTKTFTPEAGLSCAFRQWRATSHCAKLHGYAIGVRLEFGSETLDYRNWVVDFGGLKPIKEYLTYMFDHTTVIAANDPYLDRFYDLAAAGVLDLRVLRNVGCEAFAEIIFLEVQERLPELTDNEDVRLLSVTVFEHNGNSASYQGY